MGKRERALLHPGKFRERVLVMDAGDVQRAIWRIAHEILERNRSTEGLVLVGLQSGGVWFAEELAKAVAAASGSEAGGTAPGGARNQGGQAVAAAGGRAGTAPGGRAGTARGEEAGRAIPVGSLDVAYYRDDIGLRPVLPVGATDVPVALDGVVVVLCDDVLFTGRTVRAALNALMDIGRPAAVQLAVMVDRGHRELPVRPDYVGKNLPTRRDEMVDVSPEGVVLGEVVDEVSVGGRTAPGGIGAPAPGRSLGLGPRAGEEAQ